MTGKLLQIPEIPAGLREAALRGTLIPFIGAGASILAGCPGWNAFADGTLRWLIKQGKFSYSQLEQIRHLNPRVKLSLARTLAADHKTTIDYHDLLHPTRSRESPMGRRLYNALFTLSAIFVTTNYDVWLDERIPEPNPAAPPLASPQQSAVSPMRIVYRYEEILPSLLTQPNTVVHLHGSVRDATTMVMTTSDYIDRYAAYNRSSHDPRTENRVLTFLDFLFSHRTVLFIGYGLEELEILEYVLAKGPRRQKESRHYILQGFFSHEETLVGSLESYYHNECGIKLISFRRDEKDHEQLVDVIEAFAQGMPATTPFVLQQMQDMENLLR